MPHYFLSRYEWYSQLIAHRDCFLNSKSGSNGEVLRATNTAKMMIDGRWSVISKWNQITRVFFLPPLLPDRQYIPFAHRTSLRRDIVTRGRFVLSRNRYWLMKIIRSRIIWKYTSGLNWVATKSNFDKFHFFSLARYYTFIYFIYIYILIFISIRNPDHLRLKSGNVG